MSAVAGIKAELASHRERRAKAAERLDKSHTEYTRARTAFERDQSAVFALNDRIETLVAALHVLGATDIYPEGDQP